MKLRSDLILRHIGDEYVIVEPGQDMVDLSKVYTLNNSAAWLWEELQGKEFDLSTIVNLLFDHYEISDDEVPAVQQDAESLLNIFKENGLLIDA